MSSIIEHSNIPKNVASKDDLDFYFLKEEGISYVEELSGRIWTDLNSHDPGVTTLEMLCYAITDLGARINLPTKDLLASNLPGKSIQDQFYKASEVFPSKPVTAPDYRKLFIDLDGVRNCWLIKNEKEVYVNCIEDELSYENKYQHLDISNRTHFKLKGLYNVLVEFDISEKGLTPEEIKQKIETIKATIKATYHENRNLCEDLVSIEKVEDQPISICANIEVELESNEEEVDANVQYAINNYLSPAPRFYGMKEMLDKGYTPDEIFEGPLLNHGFIDSKELEEAGLRKEVRLSDLIKIIMNVEGVKLIKDISIGYCDGSNKKPLNDWIICIDENKKPVMCEKSTLNYFKGVLPLNINQKEVDHYLEELALEEVEAQELAKNDKDLETPKGRTTDSSNYYTIQNDFPDTYGIGQEGLNARATTERKSQAKQLKSYLVFFDKILASYFKHLSQVREILSINKSETRTYFTQALENIKDFDSLVNNYPAEDEDKLTELLFDKFDNNIERRNQILDHLLGRFAEKFGDYAFLMKMLYGNASDEIILTNKEAFLQDYMAISSQRGSAFNYYKQPIKNLWDTENVSGFQKRVSRLVGVRDYSRRDISCSFISIKELVVGDKKTYKWYVKNGDDKTILSSIKEYPSTTAAYEALYSAISQIVQTPKETIENGFQKVVFTKKPINSFRIQKKAGKKYAFEIINPDVSEGSKNYLLAQQEKQHSNLKTLKEAILELISFISDFTEEAMFLVEHILLRPNVLDNSVSKDEFMPICADDCDGCAVDPYSYRVSIVLPGYTYRFSNPDFRSYMEDIIRQELPAHILPKICWVGHRKDTVKDDENDLLCFEKAFKEYLIAKTNLEQEQPEGENKKLIDAMSKLNTIYPEGRLLDCTDESDELEGRIILGQTNLGTLKTDSNGD